MSTATPCAIGSCAHAGHIVLGYSDTGGGHRSAANAVGEALLELRPTLGLCFVDMLAEYAPRPFNATPQLYHYAVRSPILWGLCYQVGAGKRRARFLNAAHAWITRSASARVVAENPADLYVSFHPAINAPLRRSLRWGRERRRPLATVVTDLTTMSPLWFDTKVDLCIVPTTEARVLAQHMGVPDAAVRVRGMPVGRRFRRPQNNAMAARRRSLGWDPDRTTVLVVGGADGVGPILKVTTALANLGHRLSVVVVAGRNARLRRTLAGRTWPVPVHVYGFVSDMDRLMAACDIMVTKAGPSSLHEAFALSLPLVIFHRLVGQERGNVDYAVRAGAAVWAPTPPLVAAAVRRWLDEPEARRRAAERSSSLACDRASDEIAEDLLGLLDGSSCG